MIEHIIRRFLEHPSRRWIVIIVTLLIGLAVLWPAVDEYLAQRSRGTHLIGAIENTRKTVATLDDFEQRVAEKSAQLEKLEAQVVGEQQAQDFRREVVSMVRQSGCQIRRIQLSDARERPWRKDDNPLDRNVSTSQGKDTQFVIRTQPLKLSVSGQLANIKDLLGRLAATNKLLHTNNLSIRPAQENKEVVLELELILFDLTRKQAVAA